MSRALCAAVLACILAAGGCSNGGDDAEPGPQGSATVEATSDVPTSDAPTSDAPSSGESTGVEPATGELVEMDGMSMRVPDDFTVKNASGRSFVAVRGGSVLLDTLSVRIQDNLGISTSLNQTIRLRNRLQMFYVHDPQVLAPVMVDGQRMFHLSGMVSDVLWTEAFGTDLRDVTIDVSFLFGPKVSPADRRETVAATLATVDVD